jgi:NAD(P)-dependent dehydrogenase (short-subunit alcohol dehydrogenase family)
MKLDGKIALITGASSGIGKETSILFSKEGALVILASRNLKKLKLIEEIIHNKGNKAKSYQINITERKQVKDAISNIIGEFKKIDILVNCAGIVKWGTIKDTSYEDFDENISVNLTGSFNMIKEVAPYMIRQNSGSIINVISSTVKNTKSGRVAYAASKYGQAGLSNAVHEDLKGKGISVVAVYPSKTDTPIHDPYIDTKNPERKNMLNPIQVAKKILEAALIPPSEIKEIIIKQI